MATRDDVLRELGLAPQWQLRTVVPAPDAGAVPDDLAAAPPPATAPDAAREARIGELPWDAFAADVDACKACGLHRARHRSVPGVGDRAAEWLFVGEAPGAGNDTPAEPFVAQGGRRVENTLAALWLERGRNVYIANVLKCRPPNNRAPEAAEAAACRPYLERQVALLRPKLIVALGKSAASLLLATDATIASLRGRVHRYRGVPLVVTYHPAYLLRNLPDKAKAWEDLLLARRTVAQATQLDPAKPPSAP